jgi:hypothetical protein
MTLQCHTVSLLVTEENDVFDKVCFSARVKHQIVRNIGGSTVLACQMLFSSSDSRSFLARIHLLCASVCNCLCTCLRILRFSDVQHTRKHTLAKTSFSSVTNSDTARHCSVTWTHETRHLIHVLTCPGGQLGLAHRHAKNLIWPRVTYLCYFWKTRVCHFTDSKRTLLDKAIKLV